ncbi:hypothetical protein D6D01_07236 [Aureobasidium pullulans]|uniref:Uncharacterized protein n=1 Tax=Aureobasidium pullulans TaxID=5580 RepID=A0A4S9KS80_AURPU|nr:hypothetical protein D6D01_07236 [Aureobasidium pullulans]
MVGIGQDSLDDPFLFLIAAILRSPSYKAFVPILHVSILTENHKQKRKWLLSSSRSQAFKSLAVGDQPDQSNPGKASHIKEGDIHQRQNGPPDKSSGSGSYLPQDRQFDFVPTTNDPMRPNFVQTGLRSYWIGRYYPTGTSAQTWAIDGC